MKKMHWTGIVATSLISMSTLAGCSGDDAPPVNGTGGTGTAGTGTAGSGTAGTGTAGTAGTSTGGTGAGGTGSNMGVQLDSPNYYVVLTGTDAMAGSAAPAAFGSAACSSCHNPNAEGNVIGPEIRFTPKEYLTAVVRNGRKDPKGNLNMPPVAVATLADADLDAISTWLNGLPKPTTGPGLYKAMCGTCHGPMTPTGGSAPINIQGVSKADLTKYVREGNGTDFNDRKAYMPKYDTTLLTDQELDLIGTFIGAM
jgi:mono/diheme cytochrome c family protein